MALAYSMAQQEQQEALPPAVGYPASVPPRMFPQRPGFRGPDLQLATALADSEFAARQADEFARASEAVYQAAVSQAMEASLRTVDYDDVLRDIKLWSIDLAAATDDIHAALDSVVRQRAEVAAKLERAVMAGEERRVAKYTWQAEHLPEVERRLRDLGERLAPVGVAVAELQDLREHVVATSPPLQEAERTRDDIIARLFRSMGAAGLRMPPNNSASSTADGAGPSTGDAGQSPMDIRDLVAALIGEATRLPKMPRRKSSASSASISTGTRTPSLVEAAEVDAALTSHPVDQKVAGHGGKKERDDTPPSRAVADAEADSSYATQYMPSAPTDSRIPEEVLQKGNPSGNLIDLEAAHEGPGAVSNGFGHANGDAAGGLQVPPTPAPLISLEQGTGQSSPTLDADTTPTAPFSTVLSGGADAGRAMDSLALSPSTGGSDRSGTATTTPPSASSSGATPNSAFQRRKAFTVPVPFQLSTSRQRSKASSPVQVQAEPIRRVAAFVSLHYEIEKDRGVVAQAVAWKDAAKQRAPIDVGELPSAPSYAASFRPTQAEEMAEFVRSHGGFAGWEPTSSDLPPLLSFTATDRWSVMCAGSAAHAALSTAELRLSEWQVAPGTDGDAACQLLSAYMAGVTAHAATVAHAHDALRTALSKHGLPWDEELVPRLRWASQHAAAVVMHHALACAEDAER